MRQLLCFRCMQAMQAITADTVIAYTTHEDRPNILSASSRHVAKQRCGLGSIIPVLPCRVHCIRYDTRCYFNVRSKADISQLNLPHGTDNEKNVKNRNKNYKVKTRICSEVTVNSLGNPYSESWRRKRKGCGREDLQKRKDLSLE